MTSPCGSERGFSLIEIMVALVIVSVAILSLGGFSIATLRSGQVSRERLAAVHLAEQILEHWQHDANDYAPRIGNDCSLSTSAAAQAYPVQVTCASTVGVKASFDIYLNRQRAVGPLASNLTAFQPFSKQGYTTTPQTKLVKVTWRNKGKTHMVYLTNLSRVQ